MQQDDSAEILDHIIGLLQSKGRSMVLTRSAQVYRIEFENRKRIVLNLNPADGLIWLASESISAEYSVRAGQWRSKHDGSELLHTLSQAIDQSLPEFDVQSKKLHIIDAENQKQQFGRQESKKLASAVSTTPSWLHVAVLALGVLVFWGVLRTSKPKTALSEPFEVITTQQAKRSENNSPSCDVIAPSNGSTHSDKKNAASGAGRLALEISNQHGFDMLVMLTAPNSATPLQSIYVHSKSTVTTSIAAGNYELMFSVGKQWCSFALGFKDGAIQKLQQSIRFHADTPSLLSMQSNGGKQEQFTVFIRNEAIIAPDQTRQTVLNDGSVDLQQASDGHYYIRGFVNKSPVNFLLDTGASRTFIAYNLAMQAGIKDCQPAVFNTANGQVNGCVGVIPSLQFGPFTIENAVVSTTQNNKDVNLLGMDMLGKLQVSSSNGMMHLENNK
jgi:clan AA aspartic protease (TIGR02281 family)